MSALVMPWVAFAVIPFPLPMVGGKELAVTPGQTHFLVPVDFETGNGKPLVECILERARAVEKVCDSHLEKIRQ